jgi:hypothetical protein
MDPETVIYGGRRRSQTLNILAPVTPVAEVTSGDSAITDKLEESFRGAFKHL